MGRNHLLDDFLVGFIGGCYVYWLQVNLCSLVWVVSHALADGSYRDIHVQSYACPCVACHVGGQRYLQAYHLTDFLQVVVGVVLHLAVGMRCMERIPCLSRWVADKETLWSVRHTYRWWLASVSSTLCWGFGGSCDGCSLSCYISSLSSSETPYPRMPYHADRNWSKTSLAPCQGRNLMVTSGFLFFEFPWQ